MSRILRLARGKITPAIMLTADDATITVADGGASVTINLSLARVAYTGDVTLAVSGLPAGVTGTFSDSTLTGAEASSVLTVSASGAAAVTDQAITITATGTGVSTSTVNGTVTVTSGYTAIVMDDFTSYADSAALLNAVDVTGGGGKYLPGEYIAGSIFGTGAVVDVELDSTVTFNGHATMKYDMPPSSDGPPQVVGSLGGQYASVWVRYIVRFSPGWTANGNGSTVGGNGAYKFLFLSGTDAGGRGGPEITGSGTSFNCYAYTPTGFVAGATELQFGRVPGSATQKFASFPAGLFSSGNWFEAILRQHRNPADTSLCRLDWWFREYGDTTNSTLVHMHENAYTGIATYPWVEAPGLVWPRMDRVLLGRNFNGVLGGPAGGATQSQFMNVGQWEAVDGSVYSDPFNVGA